MLGTALFFAPCKKIAWKNSTMKKCDGESTCLKDDLNNDLAILTVDCFRSFTGYRFPSHFSDGKQEWENTPNRNTILGIHNGMLIFWRKTFVIPWDWRDNVDVRCWGWKRKTHRKIQHHKVEGMSRRIFKAQQTFSKLLASLMAVGTFEIEKHNMLLKDILSSSKDTYVMLKDIGINVLSP